MKNDYCHKRRDKNQNTHNPKALRCESKGELTHLWWTWHLRSSLALYLSLEHKKASWPTSAVKESHSINCHHQRGLNLTGEYSKFQNNELCALEGGGVSSQKRILWESNLWTALDQNPWEGFSRANFQNSYIQVLPLATYQPCNLGQVIFISLNVNFLK